MRSPLYTGENDDVVSYRKIIRLEPKKGIPANEETLSHMTRYQVLLPVVGKYRDRFIRPSQLRPRVATRVPDIPTSTYQLNSFRPPLPIILLPRSLLAVSPTLASPNSQHFHHTDFAERKPNRQHPFLLHGGGQPTCNTFQLDTRPQLWVGCRSHRKRANSYPPLGRKRLSPQPPRRPDVPVHQAQGPDTTTPPL